MATSRSPIYPQYRVAGGVNLPLSMTAFQSTALYYPQRVNDKVGTIQIELVDEANITGASAQIIIGGAPSADGNIISMVELDLTGLGAITDGHIIQNVQLFPVMQSFVINAGTTGVSTALVWIQE